MTPAAYRALRESIGTQEHVAGLLDVAANTIARRERGEAPIGREAEYAMRWVVAKAKVPHE